MQYSETAIRGLLFADDLAVLPVIRNGPQKGSRQSSNSKNLLTIDYKV
jgi:hypothetical protein